MEEVAGARVGPRESPTTSLVHWALLGLVIERPSYAYDLAERFERRYDAVLALSNTGHVYTALGALERRALIEEIPGTRRGRQPKPRYQATAKGIAEYQAWLVSHACEDRRRHELFMLALRALAQQPEQLLEVVALYEEAWMKTGMRTQITRELADPGRAVPVRDRISELFARLRSEENRLAVGAKLEWVQYAREQLRELAGRNGERG